MSNEIIAELKKFELEHKKAEALCASVFFPQGLRIEGNGLANAVIIYELANRMQISPFEVAQSIFIIHGKPSFETKFLVARLNQSGKLKGRLRTIINEAKTEAYCEAIEAETGEILRGTTITLEIAKREGWLGKNGSKWQTMPELMLRYRAQSFFINEYFPEVKFGLKTTDEAEDIIEARFTQNNAPRTQNEAEVIETIDLNQIALNEPLKEQENTEINYFAEIKNRLEKARFNDIIKNYVLNAIEKNPNLAQEFYNSDKKLDDFINDFVAKENKERKEISQKAKAIMAAANNITDETKQKAFKVGYTGDKLKLFQFLTSEKGITSDEAIGLIQQFAPTGTLAKALLENGERLENAISEYFNLEIKL